MGNRATVHFGNIPISNMAWNFFKDKGHIPHDILLALQETSDQIGKLSGKGRKRRTRAIASEELDKLVGILKIDINSTSLTEAIQGDFMQHVEAGLKGKPILN